MFGFVRWPWSRSPKNDPVLVLPKAKAKSPTLLFVARRETLLVTYVSNKTKKVRVLYLTNKEASTVLCSVVKHAGSGRARKKCRGKHKT